MNIKGKTVVIQAEPKKVFEFLSDFNNFKELMPDQVKEWESDGDTCSFKISGIGKIGMKYSQKLANQFIEMVPHGKAPLNFSLKINLQEENGATKAEGEIIADLNPMLAMMAKRPLENLINEITNRLQKKF